MVGFAFNQTALRYRAALGFCSSCVTASISHAPSAMLQLANEFLIIFPVDFVRRNFYRPEMRNMLTVSSQHRSWLAPNCTRTECKQTNNPQNEINPRSIYAELKLFIKPFAFAYILKVWPIWGARTRAKFCSLSKVVFSTCAVRLADAFAIFFVHTSFESAIISRADLIGGPVRSLAYANTIVLHVDWFASNRHRTEIITIFV